MQEVCVQWKYMNTYLFRGLLAVALAVSLFVPSATYAQPINAGDLIKGPGTTVYYFASNGKRYVFPNEKTYFTWYNSFSAVKTVSASQLADIAIGGNVTYRPGERMVKITTDPRVYTVSQSGVLRHVTTESIAATLYGVNWNRTSVDDVPDAFFINYRVTNPITTVADYNPSVALANTLTINQDKGLPSSNQVGTAAVNIINSTTGYAPATLTIRLGTQITWTNNDAIAHTVTSETPGLFDSGALFPGHTYTRIFSEGGPATTTIRYRDTLHPEVRGTILIAP